MVDQEIRVLGDENIIANPKNSQKQYPLTFKAVPNVIVYGRKKADLNFTVPIAEGTNFNFNLERTAIIFSDSFNLEEYSYIMVKNPFEEISDFFYVSSLEELDPTGKEFNEFNDEVVKWLRRLVNIISNRCMIFETTLFKDLNNFPNIKSGQTFIRTNDGWTGITIRDINSELDVIFNKYVEEINKKIKEHETKMNELLEQWKKDIQKYAENVKQYEIVRVVTQSGHGFVFEPVMYSISQRKFVKAVFPHGADGVAVRVDDNNFRLVWAGRVEIPANAKDTQQRPFVLGEYYFLGEGSNGGIQREKPDTYYQHLFQVMYSDELQQNIADVLLSVPINQKGKRWDVGEAKTTVNDIEELKMSDFPVDKVVEVLGYYKAGDGAEHKRIIKAEDDGSGVQLNNGLWANIVHNGEVNVSWLGAKGDGVTDNTNCFNTNFNLFIPNGKFLISDSIVLNKSGRRIRGNGADTVIEFKGTKNFLEIKNRKIKISNFSIKNTSIKSIQECITINPNSSQNDIDIKNVYIDNFAVGIHNENGFNIKLEKVKCTSCDIGFLLATTNSTTLNRIVNCSCGNCDVGFFAKNMVYSSINSSSCDHCNVAYKFETNNGIFMCSCGAEQTKKQVIEIIGLNKMDILDFYTYNPDLTENDFIIRGTGGVNGIISNIIDQTGKQKLVKLDRTSTIMINSLFDNSGIQLNEYSNYTLLSTLNKIYPYNLPNASKIGDICTLNISNKSSEHYITVKFQDNSLSWKKILIETPTQKLNTPYMATKMKQEGVYDDYISYMDEKTAYDKQQRKLEQDRQLAYEEALKENPELTYEEFMSVQPMTLNLAEEPQPSDALKKFMEKYL